MLVLKILGAVAALAVGVWLGLPGRYDRRYDDIERAMDTPGGRSRKVQRMFTPLAWIQRKIDVGTGGNRQNRSRGFKLDRPGEERSGSGGGAFKLRRPGEDDPGEAKEAGGEERPFRLRRPGDA